jgi:hypothetical protein
MGVSSTVLPDASPYLSWAYSFAVAVVNPALAGWSGFPGWCGSPIPQGSPLYTAAVYNLGADNLINYAQDTSPSTYWADLRTSFKINSAFVAGVISSTADEGTSESLDVIEAAKGFLLGDLQNLKTPYGRTYLSIAMKFGTLWGLS